MVFQLLSDEARSDSVVQLLTAAGYSNTRARRAVVEALWDAEGPLSPTELLDRGRQHHGALGLVTVYRALDVLQNLGLVRKLHLQDGCHSYVLSAGAVERSGAAATPTGEHDHHVICDACGRAVEFEGCDIDMVMSTVEAKTGYAVRHHWLELFGLCPQCREAEQK